MFVARDKDGYLQLFLLKPSRGSESWCTWSKWDKENKHVNNLALQLNSEDTPEFEELFKKLKWEDDPVEVVLFNTDKLYGQISNIVTEYDDNCHPSKEHIKELLSNQTFIDGYRH